MSSEIRNGMHKPPAEVVLGELGRSSEGVFHVNRARRAGVSMHQLNRLAASGFIRRPRPRVCVLAAFPRTWRQDAAVAQVWAEPHGVLSHGTAACLWGLRNFAPRVPIDITSDRYLRSRSGGIVVHRTRRWLAGDVCNRGRFRLTSPTRTIIDLAGRLSTGPLRDALDEVLIRELTTLERVRRRLEELGRAGRSGSGRLDQLLREFGGSDLPPRSLLEHRYLEASRRARLPEPKKQHSVVIDDREYRIDFAYPAIRLAIELDGWRFHGGRDAWEADIRRSNALVGDGWTVIRGTWRDVKNDPGPLVSMVANVVAPQLIQHPS